MKKTSPGIGRMAAILNFLADHPRQRFTLTDIVRALKISRATCHVLLSSLVEGGFLYRTMDKTYVLGRALARIGQIATNNLSKLQVADPEMRALAEQFDAICAAVYREGYQAIVKERAIPSSHIEWPVPLPDAKIALTPPLGGIFFTWENDDVIQKWLQNAKPSLSQQQRQELKRRMVISRKRGYVFGIRKVKKFDENIAKSLLLRVEQSDYLVGALDAKREYNLAMIGAPVFNVRGKIVFMLTLAGFTHAITGECITEAGAALRTACERIAKLGTEI